MKVLRVLAACEESQAVTLAFRNRGHLAYSCDILDCSGGHPEWHLKMDVIQHLREVGPGYYDMIAAFSPCTYSCNSGVRWLINKDGSLNFPRYEKMVEGCLMFNEFDKYAEKVVKENPIPHKYARAIIGKYDQIIQPHQFGHGETKATCLWLQGLDPLEPTNNVPGREARVHRMPPGPDRSRLRSTFLPGIAKAYASQWG